MFEGLLIWLAKALNAAGVPYMVIGAPETWKMFDRLRLDTRIWIEPPLNRNWENSLRPLTKISCSAFVAP